MPDDLCCRAATCPRGSFRFLALEPGSKVSTVERVARPGGVDDVLDFFNGNEKADAPG